jgi:alkanesulfonate monooxygenase SsuD/methylene tetrahydromethanopterin reductase-like flavin-dependent oxidoreductase (luciferase family)
MAVKDFGVHFDTIFIGVNEIVECSKVAERHNLKVWIADEGFWVETFGVLTAIAAKTGVKGIGSNVTHPYGRSPMTIVNSTSTVAQLLGEREFTLGFGAGGGPLHHHIPIGFEAAARECTQFLAKVLKGETTTYEQYPTLTKMYQLRPGVQNRQLPPLKNVSLVVGGFGPKILATAGRYADGVIINNLSPIGCAPATQKGWLRERGWGITEKAREEEGRSGQPFRRVYDLHISVAKDSKEARLRARTNLAFGITNTRDRELNELFPPDLVKTIQDVRQVFFSGVGWKKTTEAMPVDVIERSGYIVAGNPKECIEQARLIVGHESFKYFDEIIFGSPIGPDIPEAIELLAKEVAPALREMTE